MAIYHDLNNTGQEVQQRLDQVPVTQADLAEEVLARQAAVGAVQNNVDAEELRAKAAEKLNADDIDAIEEKIPSGASSSNKMATASDISSLDAAIEAILLLIPSAATSLNKLADKAFVNSSIATATATFRGTKNLVSDLNLAVDATHEQIAVALSEAVSGADNNDYAFVQVPTSSGTPTEIRVTERYKFDGTAWSYEYDLNNSGFTSDQWAAINSAITSGLVVKLNALPSNADLTAALGILTNGIAAINEKIPTAATSSNKLVDTAAMQSYITQILDGIDATFNVTSTDGHVTIQVTQVNGVVTNVAVTTSDIASAADVAQLFQLYNALSQSEPEIIQPADTWPVANPSTTVIYRVIDRVNTPPQNYSDYMFSASDLTTPVLMATYNNAIDPRPKKGSQNLVTSGGVFDNMGALDVSELNATENPHTPAIYADLSSALAAITSDYQKGGMSIKFVQGSVQSNDNTYVQYRLMKNQWSTTPSDWQGVDAEPVADSDNLVKSGGVFNAIKEVEEYLPTKETRVESPTIISGYFIKNDGTIVENSSYGYVAPIMLNAGDTITLNMGGNWYNGTFVASVFKTDSSGNYVSNILSQNGYNAPYSYTNDTGDTIYIGICSYLSYLKYIIKSLESAASADSVNGITEGLESVEKDLYGIEHTLNIIVGSPHPFGADNLDIDIQSGTVFTVSIANGTGIWGGANAAIKLIFTDNTQKDILIYADAPLTIEEQKDIKEIQTYIGSDNIVSSGTLILTVKSGLALDISTGKNASALIGWDGKTIGLYGDSITALCGNESVTVHSWAYYIQQHIKCNFVPRGWGSTLTKHHYVPNVQLGQTPPGESIWFEFDANGNRKSVGQGTIVTSYTGMCDWQRITTQFPATIKDNIDAVIMMGGTNDWGSDTLGNTEFITGTLTDPETQDVPWGQSAYFNGGDYNINTFKGAVCSAIMKLQAWMPQAVIIIATPLSAPTKGSGGSTNADRNTPQLINGLGIKDFADAAKESAYFLSIPVIDIYGETGINYFNRNHHLIDGVHPSAQNGNGITDSNNVMHYDGCKNMARVFLAGMSRIYPKIDYTPWP